MSIKEENHKKDILSLSEYGVDDAIFIEPEEEEEIIWVSKSEIKRDAEDLKKLGLELVELSVSTLNTFPLEPDLKDAILLAQKIKKEGRRRQLQLIGKKLRQIDVTPIFEALDKLKNKHNQNVVAFHHLEQLRDKLLHQGEQALTDIIELYPSVDRQHIRTLVRNAQKEIKENKPPKSSRLLFQYLKSLV